MPVFEVEFPNMNGGSSVCLVFAIPKGEKTAIIFAQHPSYFHGTSVVNGVEQIALATFETVPQISSLDINSLEFYTTFKLAAHLFHDNHPRFHRLSRVNFTEAGQYKKPGLTLKKEWRFTNPDWDSADEPDLMDILVQEATAIGWPPKVKPPRYG